MAELANDQTAETDVAAAIAEIEKPVDFLDRVEVTDVGALRTAMSFEPLHRLVPAAIAVRAAAAAGRAAWLVPGIRRQAMEKMRLFAPDMEEREARRLARHQLGERIAFYELFWRPWLVPGMRIDGMEHLERARAGGRGVLVAGVHLGPLWALYTGLGQRGVKLYILGWRPVKITTGTISGPTAPYTMAQAARVEAAGGKVVPKGGSYPVLRELLRRGEVIFNAIDIPSTGGGPVTELGGRRVRLATGTAALAKETGAPIVPIYGLRQGGRPMARVLPAINPEEFEDRDALHIHLADLSNRILTSNAGHLNSMFFDLFRMAVVEDGEDSADRSG